MCAIRAAECFSVCSHLLLALAAAVASLVHCTLRLSFSPYRGFLTLPIPRETPNLLLIRSYTLSTLLQSSQLCRLVPCPNTMTTRDSWKSRDFHLCCTMYPGEERCRTGISPVSFRPLPGVETALFLTAWTGHLGHSGFPPDVRLPGRRPRRGAQGRAQMHAAVKFPAVLCPLPPHSIHTQHTMHTHYM